MYIKINTNIVAKFSTLYRAVTWAVVRGTDTIYGDNSGSLNTKSCRMAYRWNVSQICVRCTEISLSNATLPLTVLKGKSSTHELIFPTSCTIFTIYSCYMFLSQIVTIFKELQIPQTYTACTAVNQT